MSIEILKDGRVAYLMKTPRRGSTHRVMTPVEFLGRLAILVPPPCYPLVRYHGVFAARSSWRKLATPKPPAGAPKRETSKPCTSPRPDAPPVSPSRAAPKTTVPKGTVPSAAHATPTAVLEDPTSITVKHWCRILEGELFAASSRVDWAVLMKRTFGFEALRCPNCDAKMRLLATVTEPDAIHKILSHLGLRTEPLPRARARDPTGKTAFGFDAA